MEGITQNPDGSYSWDCSIEREYHRRSGKGALWCVLITCILVIVIYLLTSRGENLWIPLLIIGVILLIGLPLIWLWNSAEDPHECYLMNDQHVKTGYGKSAVFADFQKTTAVTVTEKYIEMIGKYGSTRVYVPAGEMDFVREFILEHVSEDAVIRR